MGKVLPHTDLALTSPARQRYAPRILPPVTTLSSAYLHKHLSRLQRSVPMALLNRFIEIDVMTQAASLSFYALLSLAPLLVLLLWLTASLYPPAQEALVQQIGQLAGGSAAEVAQTIIRNATDQPGVGSLAGVWSTLLLFIGATAVFAQLQNALNLIFRTDKQRLDGLMAWLQKRVFSFGVILALGFLLIVSMIATTALQVVFARLPSVLPAVGYVTTLALYSLAFAFLYRYLPDRTVDWRQAFWAASSPRCCSRWAATPSACTSPPPRRVAPTVRWGHWSFAGVDVLRLGGVLRRRLDHCGDRRAGALASQAARGGVDPEHPPVIVPPADAAPASSTSDSHALPRG